MPIQEIANKNQYALIGRICDGDKRYASSVGIALSYLITIEALMETYKNWNHIMEIGVEE